MSQFPNYLEKILTNTALEEVRKDVKAGAYGLVFSISESNRSSQISNQQDILKKGFVEFNNVRPEDRLYEISLTSKARFSRSRIEGEEPEPKIDILIADIQVSKSNELKTTTPIGRRGYGSYINSSSGKLVNMVIRIPGGFRKDEKNWVLVKALLEYQQDYTIFEFDSEFLGTIMPGKRLLLTNIAFSDSSESSNMIELQCSLVEVNEKLRLF